MDSHLSLRCRRDGWCCGSDRAGRGWRSRRTGRGALGVRTARGRRSCGLRLVWSRPGSSWPGLSGRDLRVLLGRALTPAPKPARTLEDLGREPGVVEERAGMNEKRVVAQVRRRAVAELAAVAAAGW